MPFFNPGKALQEFIVWLIMVVKRVVDSYELLYSQGLKTCDWSDLVVENLKYHI